MITEVSANLLDFPNNVNIILQNCNCFNVMGAGLALQIKNEYPAAWEADCEAARKGENKLGAMSRAVLPSGKMIINLYAQYDYGTDSRKLNYDALYHGLERLKISLEAALKEGREYRVGIPYGIGCGLSGGSWRVVRAMIDDLFLDSPIKLTIVKWKQK